MEKFTAGELCLHVKWSVKADTWLHIHLGIYKPSILSSEVSHLSKSVTLPQPVSFFILQFQTLLSIAQYAKFGVCTSLHNL